MPLYDCVLLMKPHVKKEAMMDLISRVGKHVYARNGVLTGIKNFDTVQLGYGIKKLDGRYFQGQLMQMTMMATPNINKELHYLNKDDRLLRWLLVKHRDTAFRLGLEKREDERFPRSRYALDVLADEGGKGGFSMFSQARIFADEDGDVDDDEDDYDDHEVDAGEAEGEKNEV